MSTSTSTESHALSLRVSQLRWEADDVVGLMLTSASSAELPPWEPGAHLDLRLPSGLSRQYSLCGDPQNRDEYEIAVRLESESRGGSAEIHNTALIGRVLTATEVRNHFRLQAATSYLFVAGGIGITPLLPMLRDVDRRGVPWSLVYCGHGRASMPFLTELAAYGEERVQIIDTSARPRPDLAALVGSLPAGAAVYCCGPNSLLDAITETAEAAGVPCETEHFGAGPPLAGLDDDAVELELRRSGITVTAGPDTTLLEAIRDAAIEIEFDCEEGYCGTCETAVLAGVPDHRDVILSKSERAAGKTFFPCVSRACGRKLVLDL